MAAQGPPGAAMAMAVPQPEPGRCAHFVLRKRRFCRMIPAPGRRFCGEHGHEEVQGPLSGREGGRARGGPALVARLGQAALVLPLSLGMPGAGSSPAVALTLHLGFIRLESSQVLSSRLPFSIPVNSLILNRCFMKLMPLNSFFKTQH